MKPLTKTGIFIIPEFEGIMVWKPSIYSPRQVSTEQFLATCGCCPVTVVMSLGFHRWEPTLDPSIEPDDWFDETNDDASFVLEERKRRSFKDFLSANQKDFVSSDTILYQRPIEICMRNTAYYTPVYDDLGAIKSWDAMMVRDKHN